MEAEAMINDMTMLNFIRQNTQMGRQGIMDVLPKVENENSSFTGALNQQMREYESIYAEADKMLGELGGQRENISAMSKISSQMMTTMKTMTDSSVSHIADMMIQGSSMGVTKIIQHQKDYDQSNPRISALADKLLRTEQKNIEELKKFL